jgi:hypothetical protein
MKDKNCIYNLFIIIHNHKVIETLLKTEKCKQYILKWDAVGSILKQTKGKHQ